MTTMTRQQEIQRIWNDYQGLYVLGGVLIGLLLFPFLELLINDLSQLLIGLVPEAIGIGFTVFFLDRIYQKREIEGLKRRLVREASSKSNETAKSAVDWLRHEDWVQQDSIVLLKGADLNEANLAGADLEYTDLRGTHFNEANLAGADLREADLRGADLEYANLKGAKLEYATLAGAYMFNAKLEGTNLDATFLKDATLPDGTKWTAETDMGRFTDPKHPDFWQPEDLID